MALSVFSDVAAFWRVTCDFKSCWSITFRVFEASSIQLSQCVSISLCNLILHSPKKIRLIQIYFNCDNFQLLNFWWSSESYWIFFTLSVVWDWCMADSALQTLPPFSENFLITYKRNFITIITILWFWIFSCYYFSFYTQCWIYLKYLEVINIRFYFW